MLGKVYTEADVQTTYDQLELEHKNDLAEHGVVLPPLKNKGGYNTRALQLVYLRMHMRTLVSKDDISEFVRSFVMDAALDQQPRHLWGSKGGWDVKGSGRKKHKFGGKPVPNGFYVLVSTTNPSPEFILKRMKRLGIVKAEDWDSLLDAYDHRCATCGEKSKGSLDKGHMDPRKPLEMGNIIPMCQDCNNWALDKFVFDIRGRVVGLASPTLVEASDASVQHEILLALQQRFGSGAKSRLTKK